MAFRGVCSLPSAASERLDGVNCINAQDMKRLWISYIIFNFIFR